MKLDVAMASGTSTGTNGIMVFLGNGDGTLQTGVLSTISNIANLGAVGDFDSDGKAGSGWNHTYKSHERAA